MSTEQRPEPLRLGSTAPNFKADTTTGPIDFHDFIGDKWVILFSHPEDYTPVCTTELGAFAKLEPEFTKRGVKLIGLSANTVDSHGGWIKDIDEVSGSNLKFPIIGDKERKVAYAYDMLDHQDVTNVDEKGIAFTIRSVFIIDPKKTIRTILSYPASTGRNTAEVLRIVDSLQTGDKNKVTTPINWVPGDDVIVHPTVKTEDAQKIYPNLRIVKPYLRFTPLPKEQTSTPAAQSTSGLSGLVCNVHRTTGREPHPLVGATTTILGDKLYVFGGRRLSRTRPQLTNDLYELDLVSRHWTKLDMKGDVPPPRYFHSVCALGDTKLVCYGGMSPAILPNGQPAAPNQQVNPQDPQPEVVVMSDIHIFDVNTRIWMNVPTPDSPQGRYAHCAAILPSSAVFSSANATHSAIHHNPASAHQPNQGSIGVSLDGAGGAEMVVVGGQDSANHYIEQVSVFNLRSLKWTATNSLGRSCGAYRSVIAPLTSMPASQIGAGGSKDDPGADEQDPESASKGSSMLIYSNYNFLDVKLELQVRLPDGTLTEKPMGGTFTPPGLRFPNGGIIANHFVEYALWALDLRNLTWSRIDAGGSIFSQGSWNRGVLWGRRNTFVILGNRKRSLVEDYNHRRINFSNICMVELEAFGLYDNPRRTAPTSGYISVSSALQQNQADLSTAGGRHFGSAAEELGQMALNLREMADMEFLAVGGERIPVNSHLVARRWGPYFNQLLRDGTWGAEGNSDAATLRPFSSHPSRNSSITITPSIRTTYTATPSNASTAATVTPFDPPDANSPTPTSRPRTLYLPHTHLTLQALAHYLYTSTLPAPNSTLCTPQILCSLLQLARPYRVNGLLEAVIERLHMLLDGRNTAAIFNAAAMAAGGGDAITFFNGQTAGLPGAERDGAPGSLNALHLQQSGPVGRKQSTAGIVPSSSSTSLASSALGLNAMGGMSRSGSSLRVNTDLAGNGNRDDDQMSSASTETSSSELGSATGMGGDREVWGGEVSAVVGLQKRGLRGLMEGRRIREMGRGGEEGGRVGLGIAG
ncbi:uncharacterized protein K452DRAFT_351635 [Aplosporella prunicola CBS 121167]|uniref:Thioredoxin domain-containing protein n=1 Tax=Aplosporella prunicola CBS 121167 TaxID=1176127 RepID=A0A6A6BA23_9PEZI|nr:uncharacterized protein K452DRAFT_351635 [Aplosporella prunicola CBS 121167]KAF2140920.1 hypothetical protein K452DRAFT_351635 [Aplosporella prunicola CBS 121167]